VTTHLVLMVTFSLCVSAVFAALLRDDSIEQLRLGGQLFASFVGGGVLLGWLLYPLPL
jgi:hypothetical protein